MPSSRKNPIIPPQNQYDYSKGEKATTKVSDADIAHSGFRPASKTKNPCFAQSGASPYNCYYNVAESLQNPVGGARGCSDEDLERAVGGATGRKRGRPAAEGGKIHLKKIGKKIADKGVKIAKKEKLGKKAEDLARKEGKKLVDKGVDMAKDAAISYMTGAPAEEGGSREAKMRQLFEMLMQHPEPQGGKMHLKKGLKKAAHSAVKVAKKEHVGKKVGKIAKDYGKAVAPELAAAAATAVGNPELAPAAALATQQAVKGLGKPKRTNARAQIVGKIMKERGVGLAEASKIVKAEGLYKK